MVWRRALRGAAHSLAPPPAAVGACGPRRGGRRGTGVGGAEGGGALLWGGFVIVPLMQHDAVSHYHWMTAGQFLERGRAWGR